MILKRSRGGMGSENGAGKILYIRADQNTEVKE